MLVKEKEAHGMSFTVNNRAGRRILVALLAAAGFAAGIWTGVAGTHPAAACHQQDLSPVPDTVFAQQEAALSAPPEKWVCLTFDDGPSKTTPAVLDALKNAGVPATFFVVATGYNDKYLPLVSQAQAAGHQIALHSASHEYDQIYRSPENYWKDLELLRQRLSPYLDASDLRYLRFPGGSTNTVSRRYGGKGVMQQLKQQAVQKGYRYVDWNVCAEDAVGGKPSAETIFRNVIREAQGQEQCIVLMHDSATTRTTAETLPDIIQWFKDQGYTFCTVEQVLPLPEG